MSHDHLFSIFYAPAFAARTPRCSDNAAVSPQDVTEREYLTTSSRTHLLPPRILLQRD